MKIKFQADADLNQTIVKALRRRQPDAAEWAGLLLWPLL